MKLKTFLVVAAVVAVVYGLALLLVPGVMDSSYGTASSAGEELTDRMLGAILLSWGTIIWLSRDFTGASVRPILIGSLVGEVVLFVVALLGTLGGVMSGTGWSLVVLSLLFALGFAYFQFMAPAK